MSSLLFFEKFDSCKKISQYKLMDKFKTFYLSAVVHERNLLSCFNMNCARFNSKSVEIFNCKLCHNMKLTSTNQIAVL